MCARFPGAFISVFFLFPSLVLDFSHAFAFFRFSPFPSRYFVMNKELDKRLCNE